MADAVVSEAFSNSIQIVHLVYLKVALDALNLELGKMQSKSVAMLPCHLFSGKPLSNGSTAKLAMTDGCCYHNCRLRDS